MSIQRGAVSSRAALASVALALTCIVGSSARAQQVEPPVVPELDGGTPEYAPDPAYLDAGYPPAPAPVEPVTWVPVDGGLPSVEATYADGGEPLSSDLSDEIAADPERTEPSLGTVVVTAQRRSDTVQRTPIAITAFGQDQIKQLKISTFRDLAGRVPGLLVPQRSTAYTTQTYAMRGIGEIDTYPEPSVAVYVDDVYLARSVGSIYDTPDLERVEVLRGPQGTLYGRNSAAGAIRFITKTPTAERTAGLTVRLGTWNDKEIRARLAGAILKNDKLNVSLSAIRHTRDGYTYDVPQHRWFNDINIWSFRGKAKSQLTNRFSIVLSGDGMFDRSNQSYYTPINQPNGIPTGQKTDPQKTWSLAFPLNRTTVYGGSATLQYDLTDALTLKSVTASRGMHGPIYYDNDGVTQIKGDSYAGFDQHYETQEFTLNGEWDRVNFVAGLYYFHEYFHNDRLNQGAASPMDNVGVLNHSNSKLYTHSVAGFANVNVKLLESLTATVGGRYTVDWRKFRNVGIQQSGANLSYPLANDFDPKLFNTLFGPSAKSFDADAPWKSFGRFTPKVGLNWQALQDLLLYASFSQGFKSGGYDLRSTSLEASISPYKPQITNAYEAGIKSSFWHNRLTANLAGYYNQIKEIQVRASNVGALGNPTSRLINAGNAHSYGTELEVAVVPVTGLTLSNSWSWLRTGYDTFHGTLPPNIPGVTSLLGLQFPFAPRWQNNFHGDYKLPIPIEGVWRLGADVPYESRRYIDIFNTKQTAVRAQTFVNATFNYTAPSEFWSAGVTITNLTNLQRPQAGGYAPSNAGAQPLYYGAYNPPRTIIFFLNLGKI